MPLIVPRVSCPTAATDIGTVRKRTHNIRRIPHSLRFVVRRRPLSTSSSKRSPPLFKRRPRCRCRPHKACHGGCRRGRKGRGFEISTRAYLAWNRFHLKVDVGRLTDRGTYCPRPRAVPPERCGGEASMSFFLFMSRE